MTTSIPKEPAHGTPEAFREFIAETLAMAQLQAGLGTTYATIGDDVGPAYAVRSLVAYTKAALTTLNDLRESNPGEPA